MNTDVSTDPNINYNILENKITGLINTYMPLKRVKYNKYKHRKNKWITHGIIKSISSRDKLYKKLLQTAHNTAEYDINKINLRTYNNILKKNIYEAKKLHIANEFERYKYDMKNTWSTIKHILNSMADI